MSNLIDNLKRERINRLVQEYNLNIRIITNTYNINNRNISRSVIPFNLKKQRLNEERNLYVNKINELRNKVNTDIQTILKEQTNSITNKNKKALIMGINYNNTINQLNGCIEDSNSILNFLQKKQYGSIKHLTDDTDIKPTRENIINELTNLLKNSVEGDLIFIYYSGHGSYILDRTQDELDNKDEVIVPLDFNIISDDELKSIINSNMKPNTSIIAIFDCCNSGTALDLKYQYLERLNYDNITENLKNEETPGNVIFISGCRDEQVSIELNINNKIQGAMTWSFLNVVNKTPTITWRNLIKNMRGVLRPISYQIPQLSCGKLFNIDNNVIF